MSSSDRFHLNQQGGNNTKRLISANGNYSFKGHPFLRAGLIWPELGLCFPGKSARTLSFLVADPIPPQNQLPCCPPTWNMTQGPLKKICLQKGPSVGFHGNVDRRVANSNMLAFHGQWRARESRVPKSSDAREMCCFTSSPNREKSAESGLSTWLRLGIAAILSILPSVGGIKGTFLLLFCLFGSGRDIHHFPWNLPVEQVMCHEH